MLPLRISLVYIIILFIFSLSLFAQDKSIAVLKFDSEESLSDSCKTIENLFISEFGKILYYQIVERNNLDQIIEEQKFQLSGFTNINNAIEIGNILNVNYVVIGTLEEAAMSYLITAKLINVETGEIIVSDNIVCPSLLDLTNCSITLARRIINRIDISGEINGNNLFIDLSVYDEQLESILSDFKWGPGEYNTLCDITYGVPLENRKFIANQYKKENASTVAAINILPLGFGSVIMDDNYIPLSGQVVGSAFFLYGQMYPEDSTERFSYSITGALFAIASYIAGFILPFDDQERYNKQLLSGLNLDSF